MLEKLHKSSKKKNDEILLVLPKLFINDYHITKVESIKLLRTVLDENLT